jgi:signal transduction histidine kinase
MVCLGSGAVTGLIVAGSSSPAARLTVVVAGAGAAAVLCGAVLAAGMAARRERRILDHPSPAPVDLQPRLGELAVLISRGREDLAGLAWRIAAGEIPLSRGAVPQPAGAADPITYLAHELRKAQNEAWNALAKAASPKPGVGLARRVGVFVNISRRMQTLSHRAIQGIDELENQVEDPDLLKGLFRVDHLTTRLRRQAESLAVIGGAAPRRQWSRPVTVYEVVRSAIAEVEHYSRVKVVPPVEGNLDGGAAADVIHLLAELIENATRFAPPQTQVFVRAEAVTAGLAIEIEDRGIGIPRETQHRLNDLLTDIERVNNDELVEEGRIGLLVVSALARRHKVAVRLTTNIYGGTQAVVVIPNELIDSEEPEVRAKPATPPEPTSTPSSGDLVSSSPFSASGPGGVPNAHDAASPGSDDRRPDLPRRRTQINLVPELLDAPAPRSDDAEIDHNPGLMAAFRNGMRNGQQEGTGQGPVAPVDSTSQT